MKNDDRLNMRVLRKSRKRPVKGDVFVFQMRDGLYRYGRVVRDDLEVGELYLLYIYEEGSPTKLPIPHLDKRALLIPPLVTSYGHWTKGYFETLENRPLESAEIYKVHCFEADGDFFDEFGVQLPRRVEPCGIKGITTLSGLDDEISRALRLKLFPVRPEDLFGKAKCAYKERRAAAMERGLPPELAEMEGLKAALRNMGENVDDYQWPEPDRQERPADLRWPPPNPDNLAGDFARLYEEIFMEAMVSGLARQKAQTKALKQVIRRWGERVEDYAWPDAK